MKDSRIESSAFESRWAVVHYAEISLKGRNRAFFEQMLARNIVRRMRRVGLESVERLSGRLLVCSSQRLGLPAWTERLGTVFGIAHFAPAIVTERDLSVIQTALLEHLPPATAGSFRILASRADKGFPLTSPEIERVPGAAVQARTGWPVRLHRPERVIAVEIMADRAILSFDRRPGPGGLPVGATGRVGLLLSGGIDSPVAGYLALKRGCRVIPIHFHSRPFGDWMAAEARARDLVRALAPYGMEPYLLVVPIGRQQREIVVRTPAAYRTILYRRLMVRLAEALTGQAGGRALATGESLGQVASQTLSGLIAVEQASGMPILRPLLTFDKGEIIAVAERIGTLALSQQPGDDCCQFLSSHSVAVHPTLERVLEAEASLEIGRLVEEALTQARRVRVEGAT